MMWALLRLLRLRLSLLNAVSAAGGYLLFPADVHATAIIAVFCGVALLAAGGSALNQVMDMDLDRLMERTMLRPLPQGQLSPLSASLIGAAAVLAGLTLLGYFGGLKPVLFGAAALFWYLVVYTPLKRQTSFALVIGAVCGALAPVIGWCLAGGQYFDFRIVLLSGVLYLWQIPHFWLLQRRHADDYRAAGIPLFGASETGFGFIGVWMMALISAALMLPVFGVIEKQASVWYAMLLLPLMLLTLLRHEKTLFSYLNLFPVMISLALFFR
jgi:protoheme IX farnesyltransferase